MFLYIYLDSVCLALDSVLFLTVTRASTYCIGNVIDGQFLKPPTTSLPSERRENYGPEVSDEPLNAIVASELLDGGHDGALEHHERGRRENAEGHPHQQVRPEGDRGVLELMQGKLA